MKGCGRLSVVVEMLGITLVRAEGKGLWRVVCCGFGASLLGGLGWTGCGRRWICGITADGRQLREG